VRRREQQHPALLSCLIYFIVYIALFRVANRQ